MNIEYVHSLCGEVLHVLHLVRFKRHEHLCRNQIQDDVRRIAEGLRGSDKVLQQLAQKTGLDAKMLWRGDN